MHDFNDDEYIRQNWLIKAYKFFPYNPKLAERAKIMRQNMTKYEQLLWDNCLKEFNKRWANKIWVLRQKVIDNYIADFYIHKAKLIIEVDWKIHENRKEYDKIRDIILKKYWLQILRIKNEELENNPEQIYQKIKNLIIPPFKKGS